MGEVAGWCDQSVVPFAASSARMWPALVVRNSTSLMPEEVMTPVRKAGAPSAMLGSVT